MKYILLLFLLLSRCLFADIQQFGLSVSFFNPNFYHKYSLFPKEVGIERSIVSPLVGLHLDLEVLQTQWTSAIFYSLISRTSTDNATKTALLLFNIHHKGTMTTDNSIFWSNGFSLLITQVSGQGGTKTLSNGNSTTTFYLPNDTSSISNFNIDTGLIFVLSPSFNINTDLVINGLFSEKRSLSMNIQFIYYFKDSGLSQSTGFY